MTTLHAYFHLRNQQAFQRLLEQSKASISNAGGSGVGSGGGGGGNTSTSPPQVAYLSTSAGRSSSWSRKSPIAERAGTKDPFLDVNARDRLGRTVLHLACATPVDDAAALEYVKLLLGHPRINPNLPDTESRWTPLHRALYAGNLPARLVSSSRSQTFH